MELAIAASAVPWLSSSSAAKLSNVTWEVQSVARQPVTSDLSKSGAASGSERPYCLSDAIHSGSETEDDPAVLSAPACEGVPATRPPPAAASAAGAGPLPSAPPCPTDEKALPDTLTLKALRALDASPLCAVVDNAGDCEELQQRLAALSDAASLHITIGPQCSAGAGPAIARMLGAAPSSMINSLVLKGGVLSHSLSVSVSAWLKALPGLQSLALDGVQLATGPSNTRAATALLHAVRGLSSLHHLELRGGSLTLANALFAAVEQSTTSTALRGDESVAEAQGCMSTSLRSITLHGGFGKEPCLSLLRLVPYVNRLQLRQIAANHVTTSLVGALGCVPGLQHLDVSGCDIGAEGAASLAGALGCVPGLQRLYLSGCDIGAEGAASLAGALGCVPGLQHLDLTRCGICAKGAASLVAARKHVPGLQRLDLRM